MRCLLEQYFPRCVSICGIHITPHRVYQEVVFWRARSSRDDAWRGHMKRPRKQVTKIILSVSSPGKWENTAIEKWKIFLRNPGFHRNCILHWKNLQWLTKSCLTWLKSSHCTPHWGQEHVASSQCRSASQTVSWAPCTLQPSSNVPSTFLHATEDHLGAQTELHLAVLGWNTLCVTISCVCQTGWLSVGCARQILIKSQDLPKDVGDLSEYSLLFKP